MESSCRSESALAPRSWVGRLALALALFGATSLPAIAEDDAPSRDRYSLYFEAAPHVFVLRARGSFGSNFDFSNRKSNIITNLTFRLGGGIKGPEIASWWGRPRPVAYAAALIPINESATIGAELDKTNPPGFEIVRDSKFSIEYQTSGTAGLGLEFVVPVLDFSIGITPAIESLHLVSRYTGQAGLFITSLNPADNVTNDLRTKQGVTHHFLGPAVRFSTPTTVVRGFAVDFFLAMSLLFDVAGTREQVLVSGPSGAEALFNFETGSGVAQVSSGLQIRWR